MNLNKITIKNYRNLPALSTEIQDKNIIVAQNGKGKTNFLEAIYYSIFGSSFRVTSNNYDVIKTQQELTKVETVWDIYNIEMIASTNSNTRGKRSFKMNGKTIRNRELVERFPVLIFAPHSVNIIADSPSVRRSDLDSFLSVYESRYFDWITKYKKILRNRNMLLKQIREKKAERKQLEYWTRELCTLGKEIFGVRKNFFHQIREYTQEAAKNVYHDFRDFSAEYEPNIEGQYKEYDQTLMSKYTDNLEKEIIVGKTLYGIHKDEFHIMLNGETLRYFGSRGQQRIGSFIFKVAQLKLIKDKKQKKGLVLIDDLFSELDNTHRENLARTLVEFEFQFILTTPTKEEVPKILTDNCNNIAINA